MPKLAPDLELPSDERSQSLNLVDRLDDLESVLARVPQQDSQILLEVLEVVTGIRAEAQRLARDQVQLATLYRIGSELTSILDLDELLASILDKAIRLVQAERGMLILCEESEEDFQVPLARGIDKSEIEGADERSVSRKLVKHVLTRREPLITTDAQSDVRFTDSSSIVTLQIRSVLAVPLIYQQDLIGAIYLDTCVRERTFVDEDLALLSAMANQVSVAIHIAQLYRDLRAKNQELADTVEELRATQEELIRGERLSAIGQMSSAIIHDIRGPLTSVEVAASLLAKSDVPAKQRFRLAEIISDAVDSFVGMTQEILDFAKGEQILAVEPFDVGDFLAQLADFVDRNFAEAEIYVRLDSRYKGGIAGDRQKLWRAFCNIVTNGVEAMVEETEKRRELGIVSRRSGPRAEFTVSDTGTGIPPELSDTVFEPFFTHGKSHGTGLGLSIARSIVEAHGGQISFSTEPGEGTSFHIKLPIEGTAE